MCLNAAGSRALLQPEARGLEPHEDIYRNSRSDTLTCQSIAVLTRQQVQIAMENYLLDTGKLTSPREPWEIISRQGSPAPQMHRLAPANYGVYFPYTPYSEVLGRSGQTVLAVLRPRLPG